MDMRATIGIGAASALLAVAALAGGAVVSTGASADPCTTVANRDGYVGSAAAPQKFKLLSYEYVKGVGTLRNEDPDGNGTTLRQEHLAWEQTSKAQCKAVNIGATGSRVNKLDAPRRSRSVRWSSSAST